MEISCPSCGLKHKTDDYPGAFEIPCSCGYTLLVPDSQSEDMSPDSLDPAEPFFNAPPLSFETQDEPLQKKVPDLHPDDEDFLRSTELTPPENLPKEMPYDPHELSDEINLDRYDQEDTAEGEHRPEVAGSSGNELLKELDRNPVTPPPHSDQIQKHLLNRLQTASMGRFLGSSYDLEIMNLAPEKIIELQALIESFLTNQAWVAEELARREIKITGMIQKKRIENVPEGLAVEIYLRTFELGGICRFEKRDFAQEF
jgi:hypothetical protein